MSISPFLFAFALVLSAAMTWLVSASVRPLPRAYLRFACVLYGALAIAGLMTGSSEATGAFARAVALVVCVLAPCILSLALIATFRKAVSPALAAMLLALACLGALAAAVTNWAALGVVPLVVALGAAAAALLRTRARNPIASLQGLAASLGFLCAASSLMVEGAAEPAALDLFSAAGLLGAALALSRASRPRVEKTVRRKLRRVLAVDEDR